MWGKIKEFFASLFATAHTDHGQILRDSVKDIPKGEPTNPIPDAAKIEKPQWNSPWVFANLDLLGRDETDAELNARYVPEWKKEGLDYRSLAGNDRAWCSLRMNADMRKVGIKGTDSAAATSWRDWGEPCGYVFGAVLPISHPSGGHHVCNFLYWIDNAKGLACTLDGNKSNRFALNVTDLSRNGDKVFPSPRWPKERSGGVSLTKEQVLAVYEWMVPGSKGTEGSTR